MLGFGGPDLVPLHSSHCVLSPGRSTCHSAAMGFLAFLIPVGFKLMGSAGRSLEGKSRVSWGMFSPGSFPPPTGPCSCMVTLST